MTDTLLADEAHAATRNAMRNAVAQHRVLFLIQAIFMVIAGVGALVYPLFTTLALSLFLGWILIASGIVQAIGLFAAGRAPNFWLSLISAALAIVVGVILVRNPALAVGTLALLLVVYFVVEGVAKIAFALTVRPLRHWGLVLLSGVLGVAIGVFLMFNPALTLWVLGLLVGFHLLAEGLALVWLVWESRG
jgi:uncharacterized membrane protein HdeD (DUF308 family)